MKVSRDKYRRITPAYAGKTIKLHIFFPPIWDHPRIRGKDIPIRNARPIVDGSPPHTRERPQKMGYKSKSTRITPAYAGKTKEKKAARMSVQDHPRIRGKDCLYGLF